jgi:hypothetical protein
MIRSLALVLLFTTFAHLAAAQDEPPQGFVGGLREGASAASDARPVRNDVAQPGEEIVTLRYFKIKKGTFPEFLKASQKGVWPFFEKIGARVVGMWKVIHPDVSTDAESPDYDEVWLMTRYASVEHWAATREPTKMGGNGPDWDACKQALDARRALTLETHLQFLQGSTWQNPPAFLPGLDEEYERVDP